jgi:hypothetical protein
MTSEWIIHLADVEAHLRHGIIEKLFMHPGPGDSLQIVVDHEQIEL